MGSTGGLYLGCSGAASCVCRRLCVGPWSCPQPVAVPSIRVAVPAARVRVPARSRRSAPVCPVLSHACERARPCAPVRSHPSPHGPWRSLLRPRVPLPVRSHGRRGVPAAPRKPWEASFGSIAGAGICLHRLPPRLHPCSIPAPSASPRAAARRWWPRALRGPRHVLALRSGSGSPLPAEPVSAALGQELPNPSARSRRFPNQSGAALALLAFTLSKSPFYEAIYIILVFLIKDPPLSVSKERGRETTKARGQTILLPDTFSRRIQSCQNHHESVRHSS